jgi:hypothetical protein
VVEFEHVVQSFEDLQFALVVTEPGATLRFSFNGRSYAKLRRVINEVNTWTDQSRS